jgi:hypothetical protein
MVFHRGDALVGRLPDGYLTRVSSRADRCELTLELRIGTLNSGPVHLGIAPLGGRIVHHLLCTRLSALAEAL